MEFPPSLNPYLTPPYPPFIVPVPRGVPFTDKDGKPALPPGGAPTIPYGVPYFAPPPGQGPPPPPNSSATGNMFPGHPYPLIGNYIPPPPQYQRFYQDAHFLYFSPDMKLPSKFAPMKFSDPMGGIMARDSRTAIEKKPKKKPREQKEEKRNKKGKGNEREEKENFILYM